VIGHSHDPADIRQIVVLIEQNDGSQHGYQIFNVKQVSWTFIGRGEGGSQGRLVVEGAFHRKSRQWLNDPLPPLRELPS
jgi:hypothetical protein